MLRYELIKKDQNGVYYEYYPEGKKTAPGVILLDKNGGQVITESAEDCGGRYAYHAITGIDRKEKSGTVAWY